MREIQPHIKIILNSYKANLYETKPDEIAKVSNRWSYFEKVQMKKNVHSKHPLFKISKNTYSRSNI